MKWQNEYVQRYYRGKPGWVDGTEHFHSMCRRHIKEDTIILEVGAGPANATSEFLARTGGRVVGIDVDGGIKSNPWLAEAVVYGGGKFPLASGSFDVCVADYVLEHLKKPAEVLGEIQRVLRADGAFLFRTPNRRHYVSLLSRFLPDRISTWARNRGPEHRVYPKFFRMNTEEMCRQGLSDAGFQVMELEMIEKEPSYAMRSRLLFLCLLAYERIVNSTTALRVLRANILCTGRRK